MLERIEVILSDKKKYQSPWKDDNQSDSEYDLKRIFKNNGGGNFNFDFSVTKIVMALVSIVLLLWLASGFYIIQEGELAAVTRFGKYVRTATPGANYHLPFPIENIIKVRVDHIQKEEIGFRSSGDRNSNMSKILPEESLMLTGDENIADVNFFVQWRVDNIEDYLYNVDNVQSTVKSAAESAMREVIGSSTIAQAQTDGRASVEDNAKKLLQKILNEYKCGVHIETLRLLKVDPPQEVLDAFRDVQTARADKERKINQAESLRNDIIPKARGEAAKIVQEAEGYKKKVIAGAEGDAKKFKEIYAQYVNAKDVTKRRMYIEAMEKILSNVSKVVISEKATKSMVPYLPLKQLSTEGKNG
jgi:membrane protease subunit HflK